MIVSVNIDAKTFREMEKFITDFEEKFGYEISKSAIIRNALKKYLNEERKRLKLENLTAL
ncbi:MAG: hypothetical protein ACE5K4_08335 [Candidatus Hydrothermarchaeota archaeon]